MLLFIIIAAIMTWVAYYSPYKPWMPGVSLFIGALFTGVFFAGGN